MIDIIQPGQKQEQQTQQEVKTKFVKCQECGGARFQQLFVIKEQTPFENSQLDKAAFVPIPIFECVKCKKVFNIFQ